MHALEATQNGPGAEAEPAAGPQQTQTYPGGLASTKLGKTSTRPMGATLTVRHCTSAMHTWRAPGVYQLPANLDSLAAPYAMRRGPTKPALLSLHAPVCSFHDVVLLRHTCLGLLACLQQLPCAAHTLTISCPCAGWPQGQPHGQYDLCPDGCQER